MYRNDYYRHIELEVTKEYVVMSMTHLQFESLKQTLANNPNPDVQRLYNELAAIRVKGE